MDLRIATLLTLLVWSLTLSAQVEWHIKAGLNCSRITNSTLGDYEFTPGLSSNIGISKKFASSGISLVAEAGISNINSKKNLNFHNLNVAHRVNLDYLNTSLLVGMGLPGQVQFRGGVQYGYMLLARSVWKRELMGSATIPTYEFNRSNWSLLLQLQRDILDHFGLEISFAYGMSDLSPQDDTMLDVPLEGLLEKIRALQISLTYKFQSRS